MNRVLLLLLICFLTKFSTAQELITRGATPDLHLMHEVAAKETWYAIARKYNVPPAQLAAYNKLDIQTPLEIGQSVKVPLTQANFTQSDTKAADESLVPVYHVVQEKEWMYRISVNHNKVPIEKLEKWNAIGRDEAKAGMKLIVGHLRVKNGNGPVASASQKSSASSPASTANTSTQTAPAANVPTNTPSVNTTVSAQAPSAAAGNGGYFRGMYAGQNRTQSGVAGIFKSTSGWTDGKYYALMNNMTVGTIIRVTFPGTNKSVYAKVLGELPEMKESAGLALRISDAAARELGATAGKFSVEVAF
jgi:LysM repeat protein